MRSEAAQRADFSGIRYAQCWEDADILVKALEPGPGKQCLSIASAGDNTFALLAANPDRVLAIDLSPAQIACVELRAAAYRRLQHQELLQLIGSRPASNRRQLYAQCRDCLSPAAREFWDQRPQLIESGIGSAGKFERYFHIFRKFVLPLVHSEKRVRQLIAAKSHTARKMFYDRHWDNWRWRLMFRLFFSRTLMGRMGRDPEFFRYVEGDVAGRILERTRYALTELNPAENPYAQWILTGRHFDALPLALREQSFAAIRRNIDRLEVRCCSLEEAVNDGRKYHCFNLSDIFEYMSAGSCEQLLGLIADASCAGARLAYWNMLAPRHRPASLEHRLRPLTDLSSALFTQDKAFFYSTFVVEEVL